MYGNQLLCWWFILCAACLGLSYSIGLASVHLTGVDMWGYVLAFVLGLVCGAIVMMLACQAAQATIDEGKDW